MTRFAVRLLSVLALAVPLALTSCGGGSTDPKALTDEGQTALKSADYPGAAAKFQEALDAMSGDAKNPSYARARMGHVQATLRSDAAAAKEEFLAYAKANSSSVTPDDFSQIGRDFASAKKFSEAIDILDAGMKMHAESPVLHKLVELIKSEAEKAGDSAALSKLGGLGYI